MDHRRAPVCAALIASAAVLLAACGAGTGEEGPEEPLSVWVHTGTPAELAAIEQLVADFSAAHPASPPVALRVVTEGDYAVELQAAAARGDLPDVVEVDGPMLASLAGQGVLADLERLVPAKVTGALLPSLVAQGTVDGELVGLGAYDSGLVVFGNARLLTEAGVRAPTGVDDGWTAAELTAALRALAAEDDDGLVLDVKRSYGVGEWLTYGFSPLIWSAGGDLVDRSTGRAGGVLDGPASVRALRTLQGWVPYVDPDPDDTAFVEGRVALSWVGHWAYPQYASALGDDLVVLPLPDLGTGAKTGQGSWAWSVAAQTDHPSRAGDLVAWLLGPTAVERMTAANGAVPGRSDVLAGSALYGPGGPLERVAVALAQTCGEGGPRPGCVAVRRPATPAYPRISARVATAVDEVLRGADPTDALGRAAEAIDAATG